MRGGLHVSLVMPAFNEEAAVGRVLDEIPPWVDDVVVVDNASTDRTADVARAHGARVVPEPRRGYGSACLRGIAALGETDVVVFLDADHSDHPHEMARLVDPIAAGRADVVIGSRVRGRAERGALAPQARYGNWLACSLMRLFWRTGYTDLGPFRAIRASALRRLGMADANFGWTVEMQIRAAQCGLRAREVPVSYRRRIGQSKITGTVRGTVAAGWKILWTVFNSALRERLGTVARPPAERVVVFTRWPVPGETKTRLIPAIGPKAAAQVQREMTEHVVDTARASAQRGGRTLQVRYAGGDAQRMRNWLGRADYAPQGGGDLGEKMVRAFEDAFRDGCRRCVIVGADCPTVGRDTLGRAFRALHHADAVYGPADDGGYYLVGIRSQADATKWRRLFEGIAWGRGDVLARSLAAAERTGLAVAQLAVRRDVDRPEDLPVWEGVARRAGRRVSVIIPALNEVGHIASAVRSAQGAHEVLVVDGGSDDGTPEAASREGAQVLPNGRGRAAQMNAGAAAANGDVLLFLHADTRLPAGWRDEVRRILSHRRAVGGAFPLRLDAPGAGLRLIEMGAALRSRALQLPYGDQALFIRRDLFAALGGFPPLPIMEDVLFVRALRRRGRIGIARHAAVTSARRWQRTGPWRITLIHQAMLLGHRLGMPIQRLADWYARVSG